MLIRCKLLKLLIIALIALIALIAIGGLYILQTLNRPVCI